MKKSKYKSLTAQELSDRTGVPLERVEQLIQKTYTIEEISLATGITIEEVKKRAEEENWPVIEE